MNVDYKKIILKTVLWTLTSLIVVSAIFVCIMIFAFPKNMGDFAYSLGLNNLASNMYQKTYEKEKNIYYCYKSLNIEIKNGNNKKIIIVYEKFINDDDYPNFMIELKKHNEQANLGILEKSTLLSEENYLVNSYVKALIGVGDEQKAYSVALDKFKDYSDFTFKNQGVYALKYFADLQGFDNFDVIQAGFDDTLINSIKDYFQKSLDIFEEHKAVSDSLNKAYLISLGNRIVVIGQNIKEICSEDEVLVESINQKLENVNSTIKEILWNFQTN